MNCMQEANKYGKLLLEIEQFAGMFTSLFDHCLNCTSLLQEVVTSLANIVTETS